MAKITKTRKAVYYIGMVISIIGALSFFSVFFSFGRVFMISNTESYFNGYDMINPIGNAFSRGIIGFILIVVGSLLMNLGRNGAAGSGLLLDPERSREDLKPFNEARGGMINDVISNVDAFDHLTKPRDEKEIIKIKCRSCGSLNEEDSKYCKNCGSIL